MNRISMIPAVALLLAASAPVFAQSFDEVYSQPFDGAGSSADFSAPTIVGNPNSSAAFGFNYGALVYPGSAGTLAGQPLPEAPNTPVSAAAKSGLGFQVNTSGTAAASTINVFSNTNYADDYEMQVDVFYFHDGGGGSTEDSIIGINTSGSLAIGFWTGTNFTTNTDGYFWKHYGDADVGGSDYYFFKGGTGPLSNTALPGVAWVDGLNPDVPGRDVTAPFFLTAIPDNGADSAVYRWQWVTVKIRSFEGVISVFLNDNPIVTFTDPGTPFTSGKIVLGHEDSFSGINAGNFMIYDNLIVREYVPPPPVLSAENWNAYE